ncbi:coiled-coil domain-containing protein 167 isoform X2 [Sceloporus undulatus]|uniref:coiled-coil domain-containing protein 167 isoform X2 n=1 Tax=Sceloporus undulatus TaxID=8520 RepID=UPI001C4AECAF|nr:coiled-coil domain-containing protein 167 isoform X2 [Sceloporus undulatus]
MRMSPSVQRGGSKMSEKRLQHEGLSVAQQVDSLEDKLTQCREALEEVDFKLRREELTPERRERTKRPSPGEPQDCCTLSSHCAVGCCYLHLLDHVTAFG